MPADANIFQQYLQPVRSVQDYSADLDKQESNRLALAASRLQNQSGQQDFNDNQAFRQLAQANGGDTNALIQAANAKGLWKQSQALQKQQLDAKKTQSDIDLASAHAGQFKSQTGETDFKTQVAKSDQAIKQLASLQTPDAAHADINAHLAAGEIDAAKAATLHASIPQDPSQFPTWQLNTMRSLLNAKDQVALQVPDANTVANNATSVKTTGMNNATTVQTNAATNATSRANNSANINKDMTIAGFDKNGNSTGDMEVTAKAIASGQLPPPSGMALTNPKNQRILARVMEINPNYDFTDVTAKKKAASDFTSGTLGNALRSVSTANAHLDQLGELGSAMGNGDTQAINKATNWFKTQTGDPSATNFNAIKNIVGQEVVKAIVAGGGSSAERDEAGKTFSDASSPAQLQGAIQHYRSVMGAQQSNLLAQRRAAGLSDSTIPNYGNSPAATVPSDIQALLQKHGGGAR